MKPQARVEKVSPDAKIIIESFREFVKGKYIEIRCPSNATLFFKFMVDRRLIEVACKKCSDKWSRLKSNDYKKNRCIVLHRFDVKMRLVETVIVDRGEEKIVKREGGD